jgi:recombination protein RecA
MTDDKKEKLEMAISAIQKRWGVRAIGRSASQSTREFPHISTSFPKLDDALGVGGIPRGRIIELIGIPTSGMSTLALKITAQAQLQGVTVVYLDLGRTFDPDYARRCGLRLAQLTLIHPYDVLQALSILSDFVIIGRVDLLVFDMPAHLQDEPQMAQRLSSTLGRLLAPLSKSGSTVLFLSSLPPRAEATLSAYPKQAILPHFATIRLLIQKERWLYKQRDVRGYEAQVSVVKNKLAPPGQQVRIGITFNGTVDGDGI